MWRARRVLAVTFPSAASASSAPELVGAGEPIDWADLSQEQRESIEALRDAGLLTTAPATSNSAGISLQHPRGVLVVWVELAEQRPFSARDHTLLAVLAGRLGQGLHRAYQLDEQRETALALQHAMLGPANLPVGFTVRYHPASRPLQVGGDWYDVVDLDDGRIALIVGDCVGHGLGAATVMGQLRSACRALFFEQSSPSAVLAGMDRFALRLPGAKCTTAFCAVLTLETGELVYSSAGLRRPSWCGQMASRPCWKVAEGSPCVAAGPDSTGSTDHGARSRNVAALHRRSGRTPRQLVGRWHGLRVGGRRRWTVAGTRRRRR